MSTTSSENFPDIPGYTIVKRLGAGGMASVYLAVQESFGRNVALKVMSSSLLEDDSFAKRFLREARLAAQMSHTCIVPIYDVAQLNGYYCMAMEYLPGGDLRGKMKAGLRLADGLTIVIAIAKGLNYAASKGLVHRDIKPENILFREDGSPLIGDFGIARQMDSETKMTVTGSVLGTPRYMSPEQAKGIGVDPRSDLYSLGVILFEILTGETPFQGESPFTIGLKHITEDPPDLPRNLDEFQIFMDSALAKDPDDRFANGEIFAQELSYLQDQVPDDLTQTVIYGLPGQGSSQNRQRSKGATANGKTAPGKTRRRTTGQRATQHATSQSTVVNETVHHAPGRGIWMLASVAILAVAVTAIAWMYFAYVHVPEVQPQTAGNQLPTIKSSAPPGLFKEKSTELLTQAQAAFDKGQLHSPPQDNAQFYLTTLLALVPDHPDAREQISKIFDIYLDEVETSIHGGDLAKATEYIGRASQISFYIQAQERNDRFASLYETMSQRQQSAALEDEKQRRIAALLAAATDAFKAGKLTSPLGDNAYEYYQQVLVENPDSADALHGINNIADNILQQAKDNLTKGEYSVARAYVAAASQIVPDHADVQTVLDDIKSAEDRFARQMLEAKNKEKAAALEAEQRRQELIRAEKERINKLIAQANSYLSEGKLVEPPGQNALEIFNRVIQSEPTNIEAVQGKEKVGKALIDNALALAKEGKFAPARSVLARADSIIASKVPVVRAGRDIARIEQEFRINRLLDEGRRAFAAGRLTTPTGDNALHFYEQVINLDPNNLKARQGIEAIGQKYIELARTAINGKQFEDAYGYIDLAKQYTSGMAEVESLNNLLKETQRNEEVEKLLAKAADAFEKSRLVEPANDNAHDYYKKVLLLSPNNKKALMGLVQIQEFYKDTIELAISSQLFDKAEELLQTYAPVATGNSATQLKAKLGNARSAWEKEQERIAARKQQEEEKRQALAQQKQQEQQQKQLAAQQEKQRQEEQRKLALQKQAQERQQQVKSLLGKANRLSGGKPDAKNINQLYAIYGDVLALDSRNSVAKRGLKKVAELEAQLVRQEIAKGDLTNAEKRLQQLARRGSGVDLSSLRRDFDNAQRQQRQLQEYLSEAETLIQQPYKKPGLFGNNDKARRILVMAYEKIDQARQISPGSQQVTTALAKLDSKYANTIDILLKDEEVDEAEKFIKDTAKFNWQTPALSSAKEKIEEAKKSKKSTSKNFGGGF